MKNFFSSNFFNHSSFSLLFPYFTSIIVVVYARLPCQLMVADKSFSTLTDFVASDVVVAVAVDHCRQKRRF